MEEVYSRTWYIGKGEGSRTCKGGIRGIWGKDEYRSKKARKIRYGKRKRFQKERIIWEIYGKDVVWVGQQKIWGGVLEEVGEELVKMEISFSRGEILKRG